MSSSYVYLTFLLFSDVSLNKGYLLCVWKSLIFNIMERRYFFCLVKAYSIERKIMTPAFFSTLLA